MELALDAPEASFDATLSSFDAAQIGYPKGQHIKNPEYVLAAHTSNCDDGDQTLSKNTGEFLLACKADLSERTLGVQHLEGPPKISPAI